MRKHLLILSLLLFAGCSSITRPTPVSPIREGLIRPTATLRAFPSHTPTAVSPTASPEPTPDAHYFREEFTGRLADGWTWQREDPRNWSLTAVPGALQINVGRGSVLAGTIANLLLRPAPPGDFQVETQVTFRPADNLQFAGLIIYESDSTFIQAGRGYCRSTGCIGEGLYMNYYRQGVAVGPNFGQSHKEIDPILLRLSRRGNTYVFEGSTDGKIWFIIGSHISEMRPLSIGLIAGQNVEGELLPAVFEYFQVRSLP